MGSSTSNLAVGKGTAGAMAPSHFIGRQPLFDGRRQVIAYELLFRYDTDNQCPASDADLATLATIDRSLNVIGLKALVAGKQAFINVTRELLIGQTLRMLPASQVVIEVLESVEADEPVLAALKSLREAGFTIALDDFILNERTRPLVALADIIKLDLITTGSEGCRRIIEQTRRPNLKFLAEKVESDDVFIRMKQLGCTMFQGYFFAKPQIVRARKLGTGRLQSTRLMHIISQHKIDMEATEEVLRQDVTLSLKLLTYLNSAALGLSHKVTSIRHALALLGEIKLRHWVAVVAMTMLIDEKPAELARMSMVRGRFLESLLSQIDAQTGDVDSFLFGLFSMIDAMMDQPMHQAVERLALTNAMKDALVGSNVTLNLLLALVQACERGQWNDVDEIAQAIPIDPILVADHYRSAMAWADRAFTPQK